jgi:Methylamine utilisation protein MauE
LTSLCQAFVAVVFLGAALAKLADYGGFLRALTGIGWLSVGRARFLARAIPVLEFLLAALVVALPRVGGVAVVATLTVFTAVAARELVAGRSFHCGCFGATATTPVGPSLVVRNALLAVPAVALVVLSRSTVLGAVLVGVALGFAFLLVEVGLEVRTVASTR